MIRESTIKRSYIFTKKEIKEALNIKGDIDSIYLFERIISRDEENGLTNDFDKWQINTKENIK